MNLILVLSFVNALKCEKNIRNLATFLNHFKIYSESICYEKEVNEKCGFLRNYLLINSVSPTFKGWETLIIGGVWKILVLILNLHCKAFAFFFSNIFFNGKHSWHSWGGSRIEFLSQKFVVIQFFYVTEKKLRLSLIKIIWREVDLNWNLNWFEFH